MTRNPQTQESTSVSARPRGLWAPNQRLRYCSLDRLRSALAAQQNDAAAKGRRVFIYASSCVEGRAFFSRAELHPKIVEALSLTFQGSDTLYGACASRVLNFHVGPIPEFPQAVHATHSYTPGFGYGGFLLYATQDSEVFIWSRGPTLVSRVECEGGFEYTRRFNMHEDLRAVINLDYYFEVAVSKAAPRLSVV